MITCHHKPLCSKPENGLTRVDIYTSEHSLLSLINPEQGESILCFTYVDEYGESFEEFKCNGASLVITPFSKGRVRAWILTRRKIT